MKTVTYSKNIFIPVADLCRNHCGYCSFRRDIKDAHVIGRSQARRLMEAGAAAGCSEALFTMGESPWQVPGFAGLLGQAGASDVLDYLVELSEMALDEGLLPHTNAGLLARDGYRVTVLERTDATGGRAGSLTVADDPAAAGFRWDTGPSWYLMPEAFDRFFELMGTRTEDQLELVDL